MPRNSMSKSHEQIKHTSRDYSDIDNDVKTKQTNDHNNRKANRDSVDVSGGKRKTRANGNVSRDFATPTKRRREMVHGGSGRWNGDDGEDESEIVNIDDDDDNPKLFDLLTYIGDLNRKSSKEHGVDKESGRKKGRQVKDNNEGPIKEEMRNIELEKELERRMKRREGYTDKDIKHKDKVYRCSGNNSKHTVETHRKREDEYHEDGNREYKHKEERYEDDVERGHMHKTGRARDDIDRKKRSREHINEFESKNLKDVSHRHSNKRGGSMHDDDQIARLKDNKDVRRDNNKSTNEVSDYRSRSIHDRHLESKRDMNYAKIDPDFERRMSSPCNDDMEITASHGRHRSSQNCKYHPSRDHLRVSKQEETKYRDDVHEERAHHNFDSNRDLSDKVCIDSLSSEKRLKSDSQMSPSSTYRIYSHLPPQPPFKTGSNSLLGFGSSEDDRGKVYNCSRKSVDTNLGRTQTNWNNFPNWPYILFLHVPSPMFNPFMYQSLPPMLGGLPMNMNNTTMPYHFTGDGYGNWDHGRTELNDQPCESNTVSVDLQSAVQKTEDLVHGYTHDNWSMQMGLRIENEENNLDFNTPEVVKVTESSNVFIVEKDDDTLMSWVYLSMIDVSKDLTRPELYDQCKNVLLDLDQASSESDELDYKIFFSEGAEDDISNGDSLFSAIDASVYKKAMSLYNEQKARVTAVGSRSVVDQEKESCVPSDGGCEVKVEDSCNDYNGSNEADKPSDGGLLLVLTNQSTSDLVEFGSVNASQMHSPESTH